MENGGFNPSKRLGNGVLITIYLVSPVLLYLFILYVFLFGNKGYELDLSTEGIVAYSLAFGCLLGTLVQFVMILTGTLKEFFFIEVRRIQDLFFDLRYCPSDALRALGNDIKENGVWFHILFWDTIILILLTVLGFYMLVKMYN